MFRMTDNTKTKNKKTSSKATGTGKTTAKSRNTSGTVVKSTAKSGKKAAGTCRKSTAGKKAPVRDEGIAMGKEVQVIASFGIMVIFMLSSFGWCGTVGEWLANAGFGIFGCVQYVMPVAFFLAVTLLTANDYSVLAMKKCAAGFTLLVTISAISHLIFIGETTELNALFATAIHDRRAGGILGGGIGMLLHSWFGVAGAFVILFCILLISLIMLTQRSFIDFVKRIFSGLQEKNAALRERRKLEKEQRGREKPQEKPVSKEIGSEQFFEEEESGMFHSFLKMKTRKRSSRADKRRVKKCEEKLREIEESRKKGKSAGEAKSRLANDPGIRIHVPVFTSSDDVKKKDAVREIYPEIYPFTAEDDRTTRFDGELDFTAFSFNSGKTPEEFARKMSEDSKEMQKIMAEIHDSLEEDSDTSEKKILLPNEASEEPETVGNKTEIEEKPEISEEEGSEPSEEELEDFHIIDDIPDEEPECEQMRQLTPDEESGYEQMPQMTPDEESGYEEMPQMAQEEESGCEQMPQINSEEQTREEKKAAEKPVSAEKRPEEKKKAAATEKQAVKENAGEEAAQEIRINRAGTPKAAPERKPAEKKEYIFPPVSLLVTEKQQLPANYDRHLKETALKLQETLNNFNVHVTITDISCGPTVTRYEMFPEQGTKVSKILSLTDDIKLNLAAADIRIEAPIPGKAAIGIEVPNKEVLTVHFRELIDNRVFRNFKSKLAFAVGKDIGGKIVVADLAKMPHLLIAGATGSGKSVCINTLIMSILYKASPEEVRLIMIDPKMVELSTYNGIPHLLIPVVTDPKKASGALNWAVAEMTERYKKFAECNVRNIEGYNKKAEELIRSGEVDAEKLTKMPQIVIIIDELADLMMVAPGEVEDAIVRLSQLARAAGIHLVIATQRPSVNVITGLIKANVPSRIAFSVSSGVDSRTIIDMNGAEKLLGKGDMLFYPSGYQKPVRVQGALITDDEVEKVTDFLRENETVAVYQEDVSEKIESKMKNNSLSQNRDEYFEAAARFIMEKDKATIGMLQRMFKIGFNRAARIIDQLAEAGIVGPEEGTKPRKILMSPEQLEQYLEEYL